MAVELTAREIAIASGEDPDSVAPEPETEAPIVESQDSDRDDPDREVAGERSEAFDRISDDAPQVDGEDGKEAVEGSWQETNRALAESYGISESEMKGFDSLQDFQRHGMLIDRRWQSPPQQQQPPAAQPPQQRAAPETEEETPSEAPAGAKRIDIAKYETEDSGFDEDVLGFMRDVAGSHNELVDRYEEDQKKIDRYETYLDNLEKTQAQQQENEFQDYLDSLDDTRYGQTVVDGKFNEISPNQINGRETIRGAMSQVIDMVYQQSVAQGRAMPSVNNDILRQRAELMAFGEEIFTEKRVAVSKKQKAQGRRRRPADGPKRTETRVAPRRSDKPVSAMEEADALINDPEIVKVFEELTGSPI